MRPGRIVRLTACSSFKLAIVLGPSRVAGKLRVRTYSHAARGWSNPHTVLASDVADVTMATLPEYHRGVARHALADGADQGAWLRMA